MSNTQETQQTTTDWDWEDLCRRADLGEYDDVIYGLVDDGAMWLPNEPPASDTP